MVWSWLDKRYFQAASSASHLKAFYDKWSVHHPELQALQTTLATLHSSHRKSPSRSVKTSRLVHPLPPNPSRRPTLLKSCPFPSICRRLFLPKFSPWTTSHRRRHSLSASWKPKCKPWLELEDCLSWFNCHHHLLLLLLLLHQLASCLHRPCHSPHPSNGELLQQDTIRHLLTSVNTQKALQ